MQGIRMGLGVAGELPVRAAGEQVHEPYVVVQVGEAAEFRGEQLFRAPGFTEKKPRRRWQRRTAT